MKKGTENISLEGLSYEMDLACDDTHGQFLPK